MPPLVLQIACRAVRWNDDEALRAPTAATAEKPVLDDEQRAARLELLAERLFSPEGLDRDTLERIERPPGNE